MEGSMKKRALGWFLLSVPFIAIAAFVFWKGGIVVALAFIALVLTLVACVYWGVELTS